MSLESLLNTPLDFEAISESTHDKHFLIYRRPWYCTQTCPCFLARNAVKPIFYAIFHADYPSETLFRTFLSFKSKQEKHINQFLPPKWSHAIHGHKSSFYVPVRAVRPRLSTSSDSESDVINFDNEACITYRSFYSALITFIYWHWNKNGWKKTKKDQHFPPRKKGNSARFLSQSSSTKGIQRIVTLTR